MGETVDANAVLGLSDAESLDLILMMLEAKPQLAASLAEFQLLPPDVPVAPARAAIAGEKGQAQRAPMGQWAPMAKGKANGAMQMAVPALGGIKRPRPSGEEGQRYCGTIKSFAPDKGFGFIECSELFEVYGRDTWLHHAQLQGFQLGETVEFTMALNRQGNPQAVELAPPAQMGKKGKGKSTGGKPQPIQRQLGQEGQRYAGNIKSFSAEKGFGFIDCPELFEVYGRDTWLHHAQVQHFQIGDLVRFTMALNKEGNPQALELTALTKMGMTASGKGARVMGAWAAPTMSGKVMQPSKGKGNVQAFAPSDHGPAETPPWIQAEDNERYSGIVKSFMTEKGFGFIDCPLLKELYGRDTWVHGAQIGSFQVGDSVVFSMALNQQGHPQGIDLAAA